MFYYFGSFPMFFVFIMILVIETYYKSYINLCEYLQIDPTVAHEKSFIEQRINDMLVQWSVADGEKEFNKLQKNLNWLNKKYQAFASPSIWGYRFVIRCKKDVEKGRMVVHPETVTEQYQKRELQSTNYNTRKWYNKI